MIASVFGTHIPGLGHPSISSCPVGRTAAAVWRCGLMPRTALRWRSNTSNPPNRMRTSKARFVPGENLG